MQRWYYGFSVRYWLRADIGSIPGLRYALRNADPHAEIIGQSSDKEKGSDFEEPLF